MLKLKINKQLIECGTDEAGRGCLAGPVTAAAVILPDDFKNEILTDSKQLSGKKRSLLKPIIEGQAICFGVSHIMMEKIDKINILNASILAMHTSIKKLSKKPEFIAVDGNRFIAAASILANTYRDAYMEEIDKEYPMYNWKQNKGYPTKEHREAIRKYGITKYHRKSFRLLPEQSELHLDI